MGPVNSAKDPLESLKSAGMRFQIKIKKKVKCRRNKFSAIQTYLRVCLGKNYLVFSEIFFSESVIKDTCTLKKFKKVRKYGKK